MHRLLEMHSATLAARRFENNELGRMSRVHIAAKGVIRGMVSGWF
ncbi:hypothetical protein RE6C_00160 [Rhodopirellula europaea 6C]|uniref:Uncharacterized protein n=1 Tax=Rhodopirellula europaea 6C TaxID=1263867 RepID=M2B2C0_9BACT|nr:hypothetical protein RE6C_00160 [Rhodopirellula europaea 6C]